MDELGFPRSPAMGENWDPVAIVLAGLGDCMMRRNQQGITAIGLIMVLAILGLISFAVIQMVPVYLENMKIVQVLKQTKSDLDGQNASADDIRTALDKRVNIEGLYDVNARKDFEIKRSGNGFTVAMAYERRRAYVANVYLLAVFDNSVEIIR